MHARIAKKQLVAAVKSVLPAAGIRSTLPILTGVKLTAGRDGLSIEATDLETVATTTVTDAKIEKRGAVVIPAKPLAKAIAAMSGDSITLESSTEGTRPRLNVSSETRTIALDGWTTEDWPSTSDAENTHIASVPAKALADAFRRTVLCASDDEARPVLTGLALHIAAGSSVLEVVATDSYRLGIVSLEISGEVNAPSRMPIIPARVAAALAKQLKTRRDEVRIGLVEGGAGSERIVFRFGRATWFVRSIEGEFPNWKQLVPTPSGAQVTFDTDELASALKAVDAVRSNGTPVRLSLGDACSLSLVEQDNATVSESLSAATFSPDGVGAIEVAFNPKFLADGIRFLGGDRIEMWLRDSLKPALLGNNGCRYLLMPVRTS